MITSKKRELGFSVAPIVVKRRKAEPAAVPSTPAAAVAGSSSQEDVVMGDATASGGGEENVGAGVKSASPEVVREQGLKLWQAVKDTVNKEGRNISFDFLRQPPKRQYPDYYQLIKHPIALEDIKKKLEQGLYPSLEAVKRDFDLCFNNAKEYNVKDSDIWKDAKQLQKSANKAYSKICSALDVQAGGDGKKHKAPNLNRMLKTRLQRLVEKADDSGRVLSTEFMELPAKKDWPDYYKVIKRPQSFENIFKRLKRKEIDSAADFAADVELVFANALEFNLDHTDIWEDAVTLRDTFRKLMSDLPPPFALPQYSTSKPSIGKIKLKIPGTSHAVAPPPTADSSPVVVTDEPESKPIPASSTNPITLRVPAPANTSRVIAPPPPPPPSTPAVATHATKPAPTPAAALPRIISAAPTPTPTQSYAKSAVRPSPLPSSSSIPSTLSSSIMPILKLAPPNASQSYSAPPKRTTTYIPYHAKPTPAAPTPAVYNPQNAVSNTNMATPTPLSIANHLLSLLGPPRSLSPPPPPFHPAHQLKYVTVVVGHRKSPVYLDHRDGVKSWVIRLGPGERTLYVSNVTFMATIEDDEDESDEEQEEEEEEEQKPKKKGRGRPKRNPTPAPAPPVVVKPVRVPKAPKVKIPKLEEIQVRLNGVLMKESEDRSGEWRVDLPLGQNAVEIGEKGGQIWKVYCNRADI